MPRTPSSLCTHLPNTGRLPKKLSATLGSSTKRQRHRRRPVPGSNQEPILIARLVIEHCHLTSEDEMACHRIPPTVRAHGQQDTRAHQHTVDKKRRPLGVR